jgi:hypothetical protein
VPTDLPRRAADRLARIDTEGLERQRTQAAIRSEERAIAHAELESGRRYVFLSRLGVTECKTVEAYEMARRGVLVDGARLLPIEPAKLAYNPYRDAPDFWPAVYAAARAFWPVNGPPPEAYRRTPQDGAEGRERGSLDGRPNRRRDGR